MTRWRQRRLTAARLSWWDVALVLIVLAVGAIRFSTLRSGGAPPTIDGGNWLAFADSMAGNGARSSSIVYPPVVPLLTGLSVAVLGLVNGTSLLAAIAASTPALGVFAALRYLGLKLGAFVPSLLVLGASSVGEATAWGGFPQLIGLGLTPIVLVAVDRWLRDWSIRAAVSAGFLFALVLAVSHFVALTVALAIAVMALLALISPIGSSRGWQKGLRSFVAFLLPLLPLAPLYVSLSAVFFDPAQPFASSGRLDWSDLPDQLEFLYRAFPWLWRIAFSAAVVVLPLTIVQRKRPLWRVLASLLIAVAIATAFMREARFLYFLTIAGAWGLAMLIDTFLEPVLRGVSIGRATTRPQWLAAGATAIFLVACAWQLQAGLRFFEIQRNHYGVLNPDLLAAIEYVGEDSSPTDVLALPSLNDAPLGWWVEAITDREVIYGSPLRWLVFDAELERAESANRIFAPTFPTEVKLSEARAAGISYILLPTNWAFYEPDEVAQHASGPDWQVVFSNSGAVVLGLRTVP